MQVGDDVFGEDPTVNRCGSCPPTPEPRCRLERTLAQMMGKEAAVFVPTGTLSNQLALRVHLRPLREAVCDARAHIHVWENGGIHALTGASVSPLWPEPSSKFVTADRIERSLKLHSSHHHTAVSSLICLENTLNGACQPIEQIREISSMAVSCLYYHPYNICTIPKPLETTFYC